MLSKVGPVEVWFKQGSLYMDFFNVQLHHRGGGRGHDRMVVGFTTTCAIIAYRH